MSTIFCMWFGIHPAVAEVDELPLVTGEWPPYTSKLLEGYGIQAEIVSAIVEEMGMTARYHFFPWKRGEKWVASGKVFATFPYTFTATRAERFDFSDPIFFTETVLFYRKDTVEIFTYDDLADLRGYKIGGVLGYSYVERFKKAGVKKLHLVPLDKQLIPMLARKRVDLVAMDRVNGWIQIKKNYPDQIDAFSVLEKSLSGIADSRLMISRKYPEHELLRVRFNEALKRIKEQGGYQALLNKYGVSQNFDR